MSAYDFRVLYGDTAFALRREFPEEWAQPTAVNIAVYEDNSTELLTATPATIPTKTAINMASGVKRGRRVIVVDGGTWAEGDLLRIDDSDDGPAEDIVVESWDATAKEITIRGRLKYSHADNADVLARYCTYNLNVSTTATFKNLLTGFMLWDPDTDDLAVRNTFRIEKYDIGVAGLEEAFRVRYGRYYKDIPEGEWGRFQEHAIDALVDEFEPHGGEFRATVSANAARELIMVQIAQLVIDSGAAEATKEEEERIVRRLQEKVAQFRRLRRWQDQDQDLTKEDTEDQTYETPFTYRGL